MSRAFRRSSSARRRRSWWRRRGLAAARERPKQLATHLDEGRLRALLDRREEADTEHDSIEITLQELQGSPEERNMAKMREGLARQQIVRRKEPASAIRGGDERPRTALDLDLGLDEQAEAQTEEVEAWPEVGGGGGDPQGEALAHGDHSMSSMRHSCCWLPAWLTCRGRRAGRTWRDDPFPGLYGSPAASPRPWNSTPRTVGTRRLLHVRRLHL